MILDARIKAEGSFLFVAQSTEFRRFEYSLSFVYTHADLRLSPIKEFTVKAWKTEI